MRVTDPAAAAAAISRREGIRHGRVRERRYLGRDNLFAGLLFAVAGGVLYLITRRPEALLMFMSGAGANLGTALWLLVIEPIPSVVREGGDPE